MLPSSVAKFEQLRFHANPLSSGHQTPPRTSRQTLPLSTLQYRALVEILIANLNIRIQRKWLKTNHRNFSNREKIRGYQITTEFVAGFSEPALRTPTPNFQKAKKKLIATYPKLEIVGSRSKHRRSHFLIATKTGISENAVLHRDAQSAVRSHPLPALKVFSRPSSLPTTPESQTSL